MKQYHQLLGDTADLEKSDSDEMEVQLAALVESQQRRCVSLLVNLYSMALLICCGPLNYPWYEHTKSAI
jgi:hypothetical protein